MKRKLFLVFVFENRRMVSHRQDSNPFFFCWVDVVWNNYKPTSCGKFTVFGCKPWTGLCSYCWWGCIFYVTVIWPNPIVYLAHLHRRWLRSKGPQRMETYYLRTIGFKRLLKSWSSRTVGSVDPVAKTFLPFQLQVHISEKYNLWWGDNATRISYLSYARMQKTILHWK